MQALPAAAVLGQPAPVLASSYSWCEAVHAVDLADVLMDRGLSRQAACAHLDAGPALHFEIWCETCDLCVCAGQCRAMPALSCMPVCTQVWEPV